MEEETREIQVSIIVPVFRVEKELPRCVDSLLRQTERNVEIILVDDGSDDGCPALCDGYAAQDARVQVIHKQNGGLSDARNAGMAAAQGKWCLFVDSDDYIDPDACDRLLAAAQKAGNADIVAGECEEHHGGSSVFQRHTNLEEGRLYSASEYMKRAIPCGEFYMPACLNLYRTDWLRQHRLRFAKGLLHEDLEWTPRVFLAGPRVAYMQKTFYHYVIRDGSICKAGNFAKHAADCMTIFREWKALFASVSDAELKGLLNGFLCKSFIHTCALYQVKDGFRQSGITRSFLLLSARGAKNKVMALLFAASPSLYFKIWRSIYSD